jgi:Uma2 family endonuclease
MALALLVDAGTMLAMISRETTSAPVPLHEYLPFADQRIVMTGVSWEGYEALLALRTGRRPKLAYLDGVVELMSTSRDHEWIKSWIGRLVEGYCLERDVPASAYGEWTLKRQAKKAGAEPDECYIFGTNPREKDRPDLVIEVVWTSGGIEKLEIYRRLGISEVWFWENDEISVHVLGAEGYERRDRSTHVPAIDLVQLCTFLRVEPMTEAIKQYRAALRGG